MKGRGRRGAKKIGYKLHHHGATRSRGGGGARPGGGGGKARARGRGGRRDAGETRTWVEHTGQVNGGTAEA